MWSPTLLLLNTLLGLTGSAVAKLRTCKARDLPAIEVFGLDILDLSAKEVHGYTDYARWASQAVVAGSMEVKPIDFCNFTVTYTHPGQNDTIHVYVWLPLGDAWNGKFLAQGGGAWAAGSEGALAPGVALGYAGANTDAGHSIMGDLLDVAVNAEKWGLLSPGNINWVLLQDFASRALDDLPKVAKQVIKGFYGETPSFSYWSGCSTGGRQGLMSAQRYPKNYDGILASAPAINWASFVTAEIWPQIVMCKAGYYPPACEMEAIRQAAIAACDELDGVKDGIIGASGLCTFDASTVAGSSFDCQGEERQISTAAAMIANAIWEGPHRNGKREWYGTTHETTFGGLDPTVPFGGLAMTACESGNKKCKGLPFPLSDGWIRYFVHKDPDFDVASMDEADFFSALHRSRNEYGSIIDTSDPDLSEFKASGGKMISWHGLSDQLIFPNGTTDYYERVLALDPQAQDFFRYFEAPGVDHCGGGVGPVPVKALDSLTKWVESGIAPPSLEAATTSMSTEIPVKHRPLCPYPLVAAYTGGDTNDAASYECAESFLAFADRRPQHTEL